MAKGITQEQVDAAIDALVAAGERPTIERVRAALGTGSPNTLIRMLEIWWGNLGARLSKQHVKLAIPDAPAAVSAAASELWMVALAEARAQAQSDHQSIREEVERVKIAVGQERAELQARAEFRPLR